MEQKNLIEVARKLYLEEGYSCCESILLACGPELAAVAVSAAY